MRQLWLQVILLAVSVAGGAFIFYGHGKLCLLIPSIVTALALYGARESNLRIYGAIEICFAGFVLWDAAAKGRGDFNSSDFRPTDFQTYQWFLILLQTGASIYVLIRGPDNFQFARFLKELISNHTET